MKVGNFFKIDNNSKFDNGIVYYRYLRIYRKESKGGESDYPVYLSISPLAITFYIQKRKESETSGIYIHSELFQLPLSSNFRARENLGNILRDIYDTNIEELEEETSTNESRTYKKYEAKDTYSDPDIIQSKKDFQNKKYLLTFKELILDFLFDLEHSKIFRNSPYYERMEESLTSDLFFVASSAKYDFYYKKYALKKHMEEDLEGTEKVLTKLYKDYNKSRNRWLNVICRIGMGSVICEKNKWFDDIEEEHKNVLFDNKLARHKLQKSIVKIIGSETKISEKGNIQDNLNVSGNWLIRRYDLPKVMRMILSNITFITWIEVILFVLVFYSSLCYLFDYNKFSFNPNGDFWVLNIFIIPLSIITTLIVISLISWLRGGMPSLSLLIPRIIMSVFTAWFAIALVTENWLIGFDIRLGSIKTILTVALLSLIIIIFMFVEVKNIVQNKGFSLLPRVLLIFVIALSYSLVAGTIISSYLAKDIMLRTNIAGDFWNEENGKRFENLASNKEKLVSNSQVSTFSDYFESLSNLETHKVNDQEADLMMLYKYSFLGKFDLYIFPGMLIVSAFIATFVGVFLQLIFEEKPVTEPL